MRAIDYVATPIAREHVLASAAIPGAFPAIEVRRPRAAAGWYGDGGVRLNAPLTPARALGADRVVVIGLNSSVSRARESAQPDAIDGLAQLLQVVLGDQLADNVATLASVNETLASPESSVGDGSPHVRRRIPYIFIAPPDRLAIGRLAREVYDRHYARDPRLRAGPQPRPAGPDPQHRAERGPRGAAQLSVPRTRVHRRADRTRPPRRRAVARHQTRCRPVAGRSTTGRARPRGARSRPAANASAPRSRVSATGPASQD